MFQSTRPRGARLAGDVTAQIFWLFQSTRPRGARRRQALHWRSSRRVSIHAPTRGATILDLDRSDHLRVSIHAPTRGATKRKLESASMAMFQSTRPRGARLAMVRQRIHPLEFQSTRPRGARPPWQRLQSRLVGFNPRAHAGRDADRPLPQRPNQVSIHAPTRGATAHVVFSLVGVPVSIHAPTRGATTSWL